jgi:hypothetical protein
VKRDREHLKLLTIFHYIYAALVAFGSSFALIYLVLGLLIVNGTIPTTPPPGAGATGPPGPPWFLGWLFIVIGAAVTLLGWTFAVCVAASAMCLSRRKARTFCFVVACIGCLNVPLGTALGVCTIMVLSRPRVKDLFAGRIVERPEPEDEEDEDDDRDELPPRRAALPREDAGSPREDEGRFSEKR